MIERPSVLGWPTIAIGIPLCLLPLAVACGSSSGPDVSAGAIDADASIAPQADGSLAPDADASTPVSPPACEPTTHATQGNTEGSHVPGKSLQRYRFVGRSADGARVAVLFSHFGPSSGAPFANLGVFELGKETTIFTLGKFIFEGGSEEGLAAVEEAVLSEAQTAFAELGIMTSELPAMLPWCASNGSLLLGTPASTATFKLGEGTCPIDRTSPLTKWSVCTASDRCADGMTFAGDGMTNCNDSPDITFVDVATVGDVLWFVAERKVKGLDADYIRTRDVAAMRRAP